MTGWQGVICDLLHIIEIIWKETEILAEMYAASVSNLFSLILVLVSDWMAGSDFFTYLT
jgi:hypothetical protein